MRRQIINKLDSFVKSKPQYVVAGDSVGIMGQTGGKYEIHLHFEVGINGVTVDPMKYIYNKS